MFRFNLNPSLLLPRRCCSNAPTTSFRQKYKPENIDFRLTRWFPRHMFSGMKRMQAKMRAIDFVLEVHDARIPFTGRNIDFHTKLWAIKPHILLLNKSDLAGHTDRVGIEEELKLQQPALRDVIWASAMTGHRKDLVHYLRDVIVTETRGLQRYHRDDAPDYNVLVVGVPNVGKSTIINLMRKVLLSNIRRAAPVGDRPGVTRHVMERVRINDSPLIYVRDTPGILEPSLHDPESYMRMSLCHTVDDERVGVLNIADYLLYLLNKREEYEYVRALRLKAPRDDSFGMLVEAALNLRFTTRARRGMGHELEGKRLPNVEKAAKHFISLFRQGKLGCFVLDELEEQRRRRERVKHVREV